MHLKEVRIENILSFKNTKFTFGKYTVIVGPNNVGKTNLLRILDMVSKNENLEFLLLDRRHRFDPESSSRLTLTLQLDDGEAKMAFQCILGKTEQLDAVPKTKTIDIMIFWDKQQMERSTPRLVAYTFDNEFIILSESASSNTNSLFHSDIIHNNPDSKKTSDIWDALPLEQIRKLLDISNSLSYNEIRNEKSFLADMLGGKPFNTLGRETVIKNLPMDVRYDSNLHTPLNLLMKRRRNEEAFSSVPFGAVLNRIIANDFTLVEEIHPDREQLSNALATLRNSHHSTYADVLDKFKHITGGVQVLVEQNDSGVEQILFVEGAKRYDINDSASGYYALVSILQLLLGKTTGLVAIDEPEVHLHPEMSSRLHNTFEQMILEDTLPDVLVVTHSPKFVTYRQVAGMDASKLIVMTRPDGMSQAHADVANSEPRIPPHLFNPEIFFGRCSLLVEGPADYHVQRAISDFYRGMLEMYNIVLVNCSGKENIPSYIDLHRRFMIPYRCMVDSDYSGDMDCVTKLNGDLEDELRSIGLERVRTKENYDVYYKMAEFLSGTNNEKLYKSDIWGVFKKTVRAAGGSVPPQPSANAQQGLNWN